MFRRGMRREERRDVVEVAAVGGVVHDTHKANEATSRPSARVATKSPGVQEVVPCRRYLRRGDRAGAE